MDAETVSARVRAEVLHGHLVPLHRATRAVCSVSGSLLWGNAASALAGSLRVLYGWCAHQNGAGGAARAERALGVARAVLDDPLLRGTGTLRLVPESPAQHRGEPVFARRSCCLYYRLPGGGLCGDCVLAHSGRAGRGRRG